MDIHLDGERLELSDGARLQDILQALPSGCSVAVIRPAEAEAADTGKIRFFTTSGEVVIELNERGMVLFSKEPASSFLDEESFKGDLRVRWSDRQAVAFGVFQSSIIPKKAPFRYEKDDVILGCGGYDPKRSSLVFSRMRHSADHGADADGGVIGKVVSGKSVTARWKQGDAIVKGEQILTKADAAHALTTADLSLPLEDGMQVVSHVSILAEGMSASGIETGSAISVEHLLLALKEGRFWVGLSSSTHIRDDKLKGTPVPYEQRAPRLEGTVTLRTEGKSSGSVYIYTEDIPPSGVHTVVGRVTHGIELVSLSREGDIISVLLDPEKIDFIGLSLEEARELGEKNEISLHIDSEEGERVVVGQDPQTTMEMISEKKATLTTIPLSQVVHVELYDRKAPHTCKVFREATGLKWHSVGTMPLFYKYEDVCLFKPKIPRSTKITLENMPKGEVAAGMFAMTNDSRKGSGLVGVRSAPNSDFGPTSEPFDGTNIIGKIRDIEKCGSAKEGDAIYIREVVK